MKLILIRHAESNNNYNRSGTDDYLKLRVEDPTLSEKGHAQCQNLGLYLLKKKLKFKKLYCSAMVRALQTATIVQKFINTDVEIKVNTHEVGGIYNTQSVGTGKNRSWIKENYPKVHIPAEVTEEGWFRLPEKETKEQGLERARVVIEDFKKWAADDFVAENECIGLVTHGNFMDALLAILLDRKENSSLKLIHANTGLTSIEFYKDGTYRFLYMNMYDHLEEDFSVLALEQSKQGVHIAETKIEEPAIDHSPVGTRMNRSISTGEDVISQIHRLKHGGSKKKELKTNEVEDDAPFQKKVETVSILDKIDETPEKIPK